MALESRLKLTEANFSTESDFIEVFSKKAGVIGVIHPNQISSPTSGVAGAIQFSNGSAFASDAANLFWDDTNNRLGIGTNAPGTRLEVVGNVFIDGTKTNTIYGGGFILTPGTFFQFRQSLNNDLSFDSFNGGAPISTLFLKQSGGNVGINTVTPTAKLQIKGSGSTSATTSLLVQNSGGTTLLQTLDDATTTLAGKTFTGTGTILVPSPAHSASDIVMKGDSALISANGSPNQWGKIILSDVGADTTYQNSVGTHRFKTGVSSPKTPLNIGSNLILTGANTRIQMTANDDSDIYQATEATVFGSLLIFGSSGETVFKNSFTGGSYRFFTAPAVNGTLVEALRITNTGNVGIGTSSPNASAKVDIQSTTKGFLPPRMTTTQKNAIASPASGLVVYDSTTNKLCCYNGTTWNDLF